MFEWCILAFANSHSSDAGRSRRLHGAKINSDGQGNLPPPVRQIVLGLARHVEQHVSGLKGKR